MPLGIDFDLSFKIYDSEEEERHNTEIHTDDDLAKLNASYFRFLTKWISKVDFLVGAFEDGEGIQLARLCFLDKIPTI